MEVNVSQTHQISTTPKGMPKPENYRVLEIDFNHPVRSRNIR